jgi:2-methylcitrate dehydratase
VQGAFNIGALVRWLEFNDTWLAAEVGSPEATTSARFCQGAQYLSRSRERQFAVRDF